LIWFAPNFFSKKNYPAKYAGHKMLRGEEPASNILVAIRVRPLIQKEEISEDYGIVKAQGNLIVTKNF
jgi:hypothetical protein